MEFSLPSLHILVHAHYASGFDLFSSAPLSPRSRAASSSLPRPLYVVCSGATFLLFKQVLSTKKRKSTLRYILQAGFFLDLCEKTSLT